MTIVDFINGLKKIEVPYFVLLFGSTAKGHYRKDSDVDIIIVYDSYGKKVMKEIDDLKFKARAIRRIKISPIIMRLAEFIKEKKNEENYALQAALKTGYPVFGNQLFYEIIFSNL